MKTTKLRDEKEVLDRQQNVDSEAEKNLEENLQQLETRLQELGSQEEQMRARLKKILDAFGKQKEELSQVKKDLREMQDKHRESRLVCSLLTETGTAFVKVTTALIYFRFCSQHRKESYLCNKIISLSISLK